MKEKLPITPGMEGFAVTLSFPLHKLAPHRHDELEVNLILSGQAAYLLGTERIPLVTGSMIWLFPAQEHVLVDYSHDFSMWVIVFKPALVERHARHPSRRELGSSDPGAIFCRQLESRSADALHAIYQSASVGAEDIELCNLALAHALLVSWQAFRFSREAVARIDVHPAVAKAARLVAGEKEAVPMTELARRAGLSAPRLSRLFKSQMGLSLTAFRQRQCLERFFRIYRTGARYTLIEAALLAGFGSYPQFHRVFRRLMGESPAEYSRKLQRVGASPADSRNDGRPAKPRSPRRPLRD